MPACFIVPLYRETDYESESKRTEIPKRKTKKKEAKLQAVARKAFDIPEFCEAYRVGRSTVYEEIRAGRLKIFKVGKLTRISVEAAANWRRQREDEAQTRAA